MAYDANASTPLSGSWGITGRPDGLRIVVADRGTTVWQYDMPTSLDLANVSAAGSYNASAQVKTCNDVDFNDDGTKGYILDQGNGLANSRRVWQYALSNAYDWSSGVTYASKSLILDAQATSPQHITLSSDGSHLYMTAGNPMVVFQYDLSTPWDLSTATYSGKSFTTSLGIAGGVFLKPDGTRMWLHETLGGVLDEYDLSSAFDVSTASYNGNNFGFNVQDTSPRDIWILPTGEKLIMIGTASGSAWRFKLGSLRPTGLIVGRVALG